MMTKHLNYFHGEHNRERYQFPSDLYVNKKNVCIVYTIVLQFNVKEIMENLCLVS